MKSVTLAFAAILPLAAFAASNPDSSFYKKAAEGGIAEVELGNSAQQKSKSPRRRESKPIECRQAIGSVGGAHACAIGGRTEAPAALMSVLKPSNEFAQDRPSEPRSCPTPPGVPCRGCVGRSRRDARMMHLSSVVLPMPLRPMRQVQEPLGTSISISHSVWLPP